MSATIAALDYAGPVAAAIRGAKVAGARAAWPALADLLADRVVEVAPDVDAVTFVTTPTRRARARGGDHARLLATVVATRLDLPVVRLLAARGHRRRPDGYRAHHALPGSQLLLVDDVLTTGATAVRAATVLRRAGAGAITLAVVARAGSHPLGRAHGARDGRSRAGAGHARGGRG